MDSISGKKTRPAGKRTEKIQTSRSGSVRGTVEYLREITTLTGETFLYSDKEYEEDVYDNGVGLLSSYLQSR